MFLITLALEHIEKEVHLKPQGPDGYKGNASESPEGNVPESHK
jgi:hypothetical protein